MVYNREIRAIEKIAYQYYLLDKNRNSDDNRILAVKLLSDIDNNESLKDLLVNAEEAIDVINIYEKWKTK
jgi:hypothetical protein